MKLSYGHAQGSGTVWSPDGTVRELNGYEWIEVVEGDQVRATDGKAYVRDHTGQTDTLDHGDVKNLEREPDNVDNEYVEDRRGEPHSDDE